MCTLSQTCVKDTPEAMCDIANKGVNPPDWGKEFEPAVLSPIGQGALAGICPFLDATQPLCCNQDQTQIMTHSFTQIDSVFGSDVSMCGVSMKKFWCEYTCSPKQSEFTKGTGQKTVGKNTYTEVQFSVNEDTACTLYQSCTKTSLISQASL